jgi:hypothetical protein
MFPWGGPYLGNPGFRLLFQEGLGGSMRSFGVLALSLVPAALFARRQRGLVPWAFLFGGLALAYALGPITPVFPLLIELPLLGSFRVPSRALFLADFCIALLAAAGLESMRGAPKSTAARLTTLGALIIALSLVAAGWGIAGDRIRPALLAGGLIGVLLASLWSGMRPNGPTLSVVVVVLVLLEVTLAPALHFLLPYAPNAGAVYRKHGELYRQLAQLAGSARVWILGATGDPETTSKVATLFGLRSLDDYEPVNLRRQAEYLTYLIDGSTHLERPPWVFGGLVRTVAAPGRRPLATRRRLLDLAAVRYVVIHAGVLAEDDVQQMITATGFRRLPELGSDPAVFENPRALPRAFVVYRASPAPPADPLLARLSEDGFDPLVESYVEGAALAVAPGAPARGAPATVVRDEEEVVEVEATLSAAGLLVIADSFYPGWHATVDDVPVPIVAVNHLFRGVHVPAGAHRVRFEYRPRSFTLGAVVSLAAVAGLVTLLICRRRWHQGRS